jgi:hypothetical protein
MDNSFSKYLKIKKKYLILKNQVGSGVGDVVNYFNNNDVKFIEISEDITPNLFFEFNGIKSTEIINTYVLILLPTHENIRISISRTGTIYLTKEYISNYINIPKLDDQRIIELKRKIDKKNESREEGYIDFIEGGNISSEPNKEHIDEDDKKKILKIDDTKIKIIENELIKKIKINNIYLYLYIKKNGDTNIIQHGKNDNPILVHKNKCRKKQ